MGSEKCFRDELASLINRHSMEQASNTPDFILAELMCSQLDAFEKASRLREDWYGCAHRPGQSRDASPLEVAMKALEEIANEPWGVPAPWLRPQCPRCLAVSDRKPFPHNNQCPIDRASRALATIRGAARAAETTKEEP